MGQLKGYTRQELVLEALHLEIIAGDIRRHPTPSDIEAFRQHEERVKRYDAQKSATYRARKARRADL